MSTNKLTIEERIQELEQLLAWFESDEVTVTESLKKYERAQQLAHELEVALNEAKNKVSEIELQFKKSGKAD